MQVWSVKSAWLGPKPNPQLAPMQEASYTWITSEPCHKHGLGVWHKLPCMVKDFVFGAGHPKVCLGFSHGHITAVAPVLVCMRWMAQSFCGQGWREGFGVASYWWKGDLMFTVSGRKEKK